MKGHAYLRNQKIPGVKDFHTIHNLFLLNLRILKPSLTQRNRREIRDRGYHLNFTIFQLCKMKHSLFNKNSIVGLQMIWEKGCVNKNSHEKYITLMATCVTLQGILMVGKFKGTDIHSTIVWPSKPTRVGCRHKFHFHRNLVCTVIDEP
jgi:hypothetical protein